jgi:hypothetical protein
VPPDLHIGCFGDFLQGFLHAILAEVHLPGGRGRADVIGAERLRNGDQPDPGRIAPGPFGRAPHAIADGLEVLADGGFE